MTLELEQNSVDKNDNRLRILYLYQMLLTQSDEEHPLTTKQIMEKMKSEHEIHMHRTTVPSDIALLQAAGFEIISQRRRAWEYYLAERKFSLPELKILIDAVQASKFITEKKSRELIEKLTSLTSANNAGQLKHTVHITDRVKTENEKGYYIVDGINSAISDKKKISFRYFEYNIRKKPVFRNDGKPYTVSPFDLIWDGDYYYLTGFCDEREDVRTFRVDRIEGIDILSEEAGKRPRSYKVSKYTKEIFRMLETDEAVTVSLLCEADVMKAVIDQFGRSVRTKAVDEDYFTATVEVCPSATFYRWVFGWEGKIRIEGPEEIKNEYKKRLQDALEQA